MKKEKKLDINEALNRLQDLTMWIAKDVRKYIDDEDMQYDADYFKDVEATALDAHMLVTWIKDNLVENK